VELKNARRHSLRSCPARSLIGSTAAERYPLDNRGMRPDCITSRYHVMVLLASVACAATSRPETTEPISPGYLAVLRPHAGCYSLTFGEWRASTTPGAPTLESDRPSFLPGPIVRLDTVAVRGSVRLLPTADSASGFGRGTWYLTGDSLTLSWNKRGWYATGFRVTFAKSNRGYAGVAQMSSDLEYPRPYRAVEAMRVACPP
jgi:hypothetical protein